MLISWSVFEIFGSLEKLSVVTLIFVIFVTSKLQKLEYEGVFFKFIILFKDVLQFVSNAMFVLPKLPKLLKKNILKYWCYG